MRTFLTILALFISFESASQTILKNKKTVSLSAAVARLEKACINSAKKLKDRAQKEEVCACVAANHKAHTSKEDIVILADSYENPQDKTLDLPDDELILYNFDAEIAEACLKNPKYLLKKN